VIVERLVRSEVVFYGGFNLPSMHVLNRTLSSIISASIPV